jgi:hypothetical protein
MLNVASGVSGASPIWRRIVIEALTGKPNLGFETPSGIVSASVDSVSGYRSHDGYASRQESFIKGTEPGVDPVHVKLKVCKTDGKLATPADIAGGSFDEKEYFLFKEEDPTAGSGQPNLWQEGILNWLNGQSDPRYHPPSDYCGTANPVSVEFVNPTNETSNMSGKFTVKFKADSTADIVSAELYIDNNKVKDFTAPPFEYEVSLSDGVHTLKGKARDSSGRESERTITIGVNTVWNPTPSPSP